MGSKLHNKLKQSSFATLLIILAGVLAFIFSVSVGIISLYDYYLESSQKSGLHVLSLNFSPATFVPPEPKVIRPGVKGFFHNSRPADPKLKGKIAVKIRFYNYTNKPQTFLNLILALRSAKDNIWYSLVRYVVADKNSNPEEKTNLPIQLTPNSVIDVDVLFLMGELEDIKQYGFTGYTVSTLNAKGVRGRTSVKNIPATRTYEYNGDFRP